MTDKQLRKKIGDIACKVYKSHEAVHRAQTFLFAQAELLKSYTEDLEELIGELDERIGDRP